ncbi:MAG: LSM domain-containing protein [Promethearchaeota archaeon]
MEKRSNQSGKFNRPIDYLKNSVNKVILIKVKRNRLFRGMLGGFDEHLNLYLENTSQIFEYQDEDGKVVEEFETIGNVVVRGDNVIFINLADPNSD